MFVLCIVCLSQLELEQLKTKFEKADKERNDFRLATEQLQAKVGTLMLIPVFHYVTFVGGAA